MDYNSTHGFLAMMQQGDTFPVFMVNKLDGNTIGLEEGLDLTVAFYRWDGKLITKGSVSDGRITNEGELYSMTVRHEESTYMVGDVRVELTLTNADKSIVYHADRVLHVNFEKRINNTII